MLKSNLWESSLVKLPAWLKETIAFILMLFTGLFFYSSLHQKRLLMCYLVWSQQRPVLQEWGRDQGSPKLLGEPTNNCWNVLGNTDCQLSGWKVSELLSEVERYWLDISMCTSKQRFLETSLPEREWILLDLGVPLSEYVLWWASL